MVINSRGMRGRVSLACHKCVQLQPVLGRHFLERGAVDQCNSHVEGHDGEGYLYLPANTMSNQI